MPKSYPPEFRRKVLTCVEAGRPVAQVAAGPGDQRADDLRLAASAPDRQRSMPGITSSENAELVAARKRIAELETELAIHRRAAELLGEVVPPKGGSRPSR